MLNHSWRREVLGWVQIALGIAIGAIAYRMYLIPNRIAPGGFTGIGQLVHAATGWPIGLVSMALNAPLFILSWRRMGFAFMIRSLVALTLFNLAIDSMTFIGPVTDDVLLASVFGGGMAGVGLGLILRGGGSTGGSDMLGALLNDHIPVLKVAVVSMAVDVLVIGISAFAFDPQAAMFSLISAYLYSVALDFVLDGISSAKAYYIISDHNDEIAAIVHDQLERGATALSGKGTYSGEDKTVLLCVVNRFESARLRGIVAKIDPSAFVIATHVSEAIGEGFKPHKRAKR